MGLCIRFLVLCSRLSKATRFRAWGGDAGGGRTGILSFEFSTQLLVRVFFDCSQLLACNPSHQHVPCYLSSHFTKLTQTLLRLLLSSYAYLTSLYRRPSSGYKRYDNPPNSWLTIDLRRYPHKASSTSLSWCISPCLVLAETISSVQFGSY